MYEYEDKLIKKFNFAKEYIFFFWNVNYKYVYPPKEKL